MEEPQKQLIDRLKQAQNVLVTVSKNPSVDQLAAAIGLTVALNNMGKHATAVFSGQVPSTLEFLKPEETLEQNTDSLRDFIIALDKSKADKLRYKVEDDIVRIFITPYKVSVSQADLEFSQGDFNVDVVVALGVSTQQDLDEAIQAHGRILHDAVVASVMLGVPSELGTLNVVGGDVSSLSEMVAGITRTLDESAIDSQVATAFLTGIVAVTDRFSNAQTTAQTMSVSAVLMAAGANQQLISSELDHEPEPSPSTDLATPPVDDGIADVSAAEEASTSDDGTLEIDHEHDEPAVTPKAADTPSVASEDAVESVEPAAEAAQESMLPDIQEMESHLSDKMPEVDEPTESPLEPPTNMQVAVDENGNLASQPDQQHDQSDTFMPQPSDSAAQTERASFTSTRGRTIEPPTLGGTLTANTTEEPLGKSYDEIAGPVTNQPLPPILTHDQAPIASGATVATESLAPPASADAAPASAENTELPAPSLPPLIPTDPASIMPTQESEAPQAQPPEPSPQAVLTEESARKAVEAALQNEGGTDTPPRPIIALNAQPLGDPLHSTEVATAPPSSAPSNAAAGTDEPSPAQPQPFVPAPGFGERSASPSAFPGVVPGANQEDDPNPPPPVPPPMIPPLP